MQFCFGKSEALAALDALRGAVENLPEDAEIISIKMDEDASHIHSEDAEIISIKMDEDTSHIHLNRGVRKAADLAGAEISVERWPMAKYFNTCVSFTTNGVRVFALESQGEADAISGGVKPPAMEGSGSEAARETVEDVELHGREDG